jgi:hypothetical protein
VRADHVAGFQVREVLRVGVHYAEL